jgi:GxxExxY protein
MALIDIPPINRITHRINGGAIRVHRAFGPGLLESPYRLALGIELLAAGLSCVSEVPLSVTYNGRDLGTGYRMDFVVEDTVVIEVKAIDRLLPIHRQQLLTYLKLSGYPAGLLINFNVPLLKDGIVRVLNDR